MSEAEAFLGGDLSFLRIVCRCVSVCEWSSSTLTQLSRTHAAAALQKRYTHQRVSSTRVEAPEASPFLPEVAQFRLGPALLFAHCTVTGEGHISADPAVLHGPVWAAGGHDLLAGQAPVSPAQALLVGAHAAAVAKSPLEDVL